MTFGEKLQALRKAQGWSQEELAQRINVSRQALSKWESGASVPDTENVIALSRLFGVSTDYLLLNEVKAPGHVPAIAWPKPRKYLLAAAIVGAVGLVAIRFIWAAMAASMFFSFGSDAWSFMENDSGFPGGFMAPMDTALHAAVGAEHGISGTASGRRSGRGLLPSSPAPVEKALHQGRP